MKTKIEEWFNGDQNYQKGLDLLREAGIRGTKVKRLDRGESKLNKEKLAWELCEAAKLPRTILSQVKLDVADTRVSAAVAKGKNAATTFNTVEPEIITKIKVKISELTNLRAQTHNELTAIGKKNDTSSKEKRKELIDKIAEITAQIDFLYEAKETFFREKKLPNENIFEVHDEKVQTDNTTLSAIELMKQKNNLKSQISKAKKKIELAKNKDQKKAAVEKYDGLVLELQQIETLLSGQK